jgi:hypothetical protein
LLPVRSVSAREMCGKLGIATGIASHSSNLTAPVVGVWRSDLPIVIFRESPALDEPLTRDVAVAFGALLYSDRNTTDERVWVSQFAESFVGELSGD